MTERTGGRGGVLETGGGGAVKLIQPMSLGYDSAPSSRVHRGPRLPDGSQAMSSKQRQIQTFVEHVKSVGGLVLFNGDGTIRAVGLGQSFGYQARVDDDWFQNFKLPCSIDLLDLNNSGIGDRCIEYLRGSQIREIGLSATAVSDISIKHLAQLEGLEQINPGRTSIGDQGAAFLENLPALRKVELSDTRISDRGATHLGKLLKIHRLGLMGPMLSDVGVDQISKASTLKELSLGLSRISDTSGTYFARLPDLTTLSLHDTAISDRTLESLVAIPQLRYCDISGTRTSSEGRSRFCNQRPDVYLHCV